MHPDFESLWQFLAAPYVGQQISSHGPEHWRRVERNGLLLSQHTGANATIVRWFALFHDCRRMNDGYDPGHGLRGAEFAQSLRGKSFQLDDDDFALLYYACANHTEGVAHDDPTIATCWDADRLDLPRVGIIPDPKRMGTSFGQKIAAAGSVEHFLKSQITRQ